MDLIFKNGEPQKAVPGGSVFNALVSAKHAGVDVLFVSDDIGEYDSEKTAVLVESYAKFDGKVLSAEHIAPEIVKVVYEEGGRKKMLVFDLTKGDYIIQ